MRVVGTTRQFITCYVTRLVITTRTGTTFVISEKDDALRVTADQNMFVQWDGERACEIRQLGTPVCPNEVARRGQK